MCSPESTVDTKLNVAREPLLVAVSTENHAEQSTRYMAATRKILAESDCLEPLALESTTTPGFVGQLDFPSAVARAFYVLQIMPEPAAVAGESTNSDEP